MKKIGLLLFLAFCFTANVQAFNKISSARENFICRYGAIGDTLPIRQIYLEVLCLNDTNDSRAETQACTYIYANLYKGEDIIDIYDELSPDVLSNLIFNDVVGVGTLKIGDRTYGDLPKDAYNDYNSYKEIPNDIKVDYCPPYIDLEKFDSNILELNECEYGGCQYELNRTAAITLKCDYPTNPSKTSGVSLNLVSETNCLIGTNCHFKIGSAKYISDGSSSSITQYYSEADDRMHSIDDITLSDCPNTIGYNNNTLYLNYNPISGSEASLDLCYDSADNTCAEKDTITASSIRFQGSDKYKDITSCRDSDYKYIKDCGCMPASITDLTSRLYMLIKIAAPALLLVIGGFDLIKAMSAQDESAINKARQKLIKKFIAAVAIFLIFTLIQFIVSTLSNDASTTMKCVDYILNGYVA